MDLRTVRGVVLGVGYLCYAVWAALVSRHTESKGRLPVLSGLSGATFRRHHDRCYDAVLTAVRRAATETDKWPTAGYRQA